MAASKDKAGKDAGKANEATAPVAASAAASAAKPKKRGAFKFILFMIVFGASVPFLFPTLLFVLVGMIPSFVALITDNDRAKSGAISVAGMNAAGLTPFIIDLWTKGQTMPALVDLLRDPVTWLVILGAAGVGQLIYFAVPQIVASMALTRDEARLKNLKRNLERLTEAWGTDVGTTKPINLVEPK